MAVVDLVANSVASLESTTAATQAAHSQLVLALPAPGSAMDPAPTTNVDEEDSPVITFRGRLVPVDPAKFAQYFNQPSALLHDGLPGASSLGFLAPPAPPVVANSPPVVAHAVACTGAAEEPNPSPEADRAPPRLGETNPCALPTHPTKKKRGAAAAASSGEETDSDDDETSVDDSDDDETSVDDSDEDEAKDSNAKEPPRKRMLRDRDGSSRGEDEDKDKSGIWPRGLWL